MLTINKAPSQKQIDARRKKAIENYLAKSKKRYCVGKDFAGTVSYLKTELEALDRLADEKYDLVIPELSELFGDEMVQALINPTYHRYGNLFSWAVDRGYKFLEENKDQISSEGIYSDAFQLAHKYCAQIEAMLPTMKFKVIRK